MRAQLMNESLKDKLLEDIRKRGYPLELQVGDVFSRDGWRVQYDGYYLDRDEQEGREIDISAYKTVYDSQANVRTGVHDVCEVKQSPDKPWIIFSTGKDFFESLGYSRLHYSFGLAADLLTGEEMESGSSISAFSRIGRSYCEGFKSSQQPSVIFEALASAVKASEDCLERNREAGEELHSKLLKDDKSMCFVHPVVVLNGLLWEAHLNEEGELDIAKIGHMLVSFGYVSSAYDRGNYLVDLVTIEELPTFISAQSEWISSVHDTIVRKLKTKRES